MFLDQRTPFSANTKKSQSADHKGGSTLTVSLTIKYPFFLEDFPTPFSEYFVVTFSIRLL